MLHTLVFHFAWNHANMIKRLWNVFNVTEFDQHQKLLVEIFQPEPDLKSGSSRFNLSCVVEKVLPVSVRYKWNDVFFPRDGHVSVQRDYHWDRFRGFRHLDWTVTSIVQVNIERSTVAGQVFCLWSKSVGSIDGVWRLKKTKPLTRKTLTKIFIVEKYNQFTPKHILFIEGGAKREKGRYSLTYKVGHIDSLEQ